MASARKLLAAVCFLSLVIVGYAGDSAGGRGDDKLHALEMCILKA